MDSFEEVKETKLPPKNAFYSKLNMKRISGQVSEDAQKVWNQTAPEFENLTLGNTMTFT